MDDANDLAMCLAYGPPDGNTYREAQYQNANGDLFCVVGFPATEVFMSGASTGLDRPAWDAEPYVVNMSGARRAQALLTVSPEPMPADTDKIVVRVGPNSLAAINEIGLVANGSKYEN